MSERASTKRRTAAMVALVAVVLSPAVAAITLLLLLTPESESTVPDATPTTTVPVQTFDPGVPNVSSRVGPGSTVNEFLPVDRGLGECISAIPKPGCGSEARGGWRQSLVLLAILVGLTLITWRIVVSARRARAEQLPRS